MYVLILTITSDGPAEQIPDGQVQNPQPGGSPCAETETSPPVVSSEVPHVSAIDDGQPQSPKAKRAQQAKVDHVGATAMYHALAKAFHFQRRDGPANQIADGQIQNQPTVPVVSSACPTPSSEVAPVTAIADGQPQAPKVKRDGPANQIADGQVQNQPTAPVISTACPTPSSQVAPVTAIADGQPQAPKAKRDGPANQMADGQVQNQPNAVPVSSAASPCEVSSSEVPQVTVIADGQPQSPKIKRDGPANQIADGQVQNLPNASPVSSVGPACYVSSEVPQVTVIADGQPQAPKAKRDNGPVGQILDGQIQNQPTAPLVSSACPPSSEMPAVSAIADGQPQAPKAKRDNGPVGQILDGQVQNQPTASPVSSAGPACSASSEMPAVSAIADGQPQAPKLKRANGPANQIADGQVQNQPSASPVSSASSACPCSSAMSAVSAIADGQPQAPKPERVCVHHGTLSTHDVTQIADGQVQNGCAAKSNPVSQIADGQIQNVHPVKQITDGQVQDVRPVRQIADGQIQHVNPAQQIGDGQVQRVNPAQQIGDGQIQRVDPAQQIGDGQVQRTSGMQEIGDGQTPNVNPAQQISDGQIQSKPLPSPCTYPVPGFGNNTVGYNTTKCGMSAGPQVTEIADGQPQAPGHLPRPGPFRLFSRAARNVVRVASALSKRCDSPSASKRSIPAGANTKSSAVVRLAPRDFDAAASAEAATVLATDAATEGGAPRLFTCASPGTLRMTLADGVLKDGLGRTGYIADNYQFQFDAPPQAGAIVTAGFSFCDDGRLALGGQTEWWQCSSGGFYNLYDRKWAPHCEPVEFRAVEVVDC